MSSAGSSLAPAPDFLIGRTTPLKDVLAALTQRGCADLTDSINLRVCSKLPVAGGGFCDVFRGELKNGHKVAIKTLRIYDKPGEEDERQKILKRTAKEIYYWSQLNHLNVLELQGLAIFNGHMSMVSRWMENGDMRSYIRHNPNADRLNLCLGVSGGLCHIHAEGMVHGDLKAANVMVSRHGVPQITDFGNSQLKDTTLNFTDTMSFSHSLRWAAPELLDTDDGPHASREADVYTYAMTVLEVMTGEVPFQSISDNQVIVLLLSGGEVLRPNAPIADRLWNILQHCWDTVASERPIIARVRKQIEHFAIRHYSDAIAKYPREARHRIGRAGVYAGLRKFARALRDCRKAEKLESPSPTSTAILLGGICHLELGNASSCLKALRCLSSSMPQISDLRYRAEQLESDLQQFESSRRRDDWDNALLALDRAVKVHRGDLPLKWRCWRVQCEVARGDWAGAQTAISEALRPAPKSPQVLTLRGVVMFLTNQIPLAIEHAGKALRLARGYRSARKLFERASQVQRFKRESNMFFRAGQLRKAVERHGRALEMVGQHVSEGGSGHLRAALLSHRAAMQFKLEDFESALEDTNASLALNPNSYKALHTRARIHIKFGRLEDAIRDFKAARESAAGGSVGRNELHILVKEARMAEVMLHRCKSKDAHRALSTRSRKY